MKDQENKQQPSPRTVVDDNQRTDYDENNDVNDESRMRRRSVEEINNNTSQSTPPLPEIDLTNSNENNEMKSATDDSEDDELEEEETSSMFSRCLSRTPPRKYFVWAMSLWVFELLLVITLKRFGVLQKDSFEDIVQQAVMDRVQNTVLPSINQSIETLTQSMTSPERKTVGHELAEQGATMNYPIVMVPGFVTSGLEVWAGKECTKGYFRQRIWAALTGAKSFLVERDCWKEHMTLDTYTGSDPDGIRVRASEGFAATDYFMMNYWVWGKLIENLAEVGYTPSDMVMEPYDWRLSFPLLEERDGYFTNLKSRIEALHKRTGKKVVLATHSMGAMVVHHFFGWVTSSENDGGGGGGKKWVDKHIDTYINIAGSHLGVPKAATALLSGEMRDTVFGGRMASMVERFFGRRLRRELWTSWGSLWAMLPKGGDALWGPGVDMCEERSSDDIFCPEISESGDTMSPLIGMTDNQELPEDFNINVTCNNDDLNITLETFVKQESHSTENTIEFLSKYGSGLGKDTAGPRFASQFGVEKDKKRQWYDVTRSPLPYAPNMKIFCLYGTGLPTERGYFYKRNYIQEDENKNITNKITDPVVIIDTETDADNGKNVSYGIKYADGDGSVPLISLGYICADAWKRDNSGLNPSHSKVYTREYKHKAEFSMDDPMRGGPASSDHVDILGNIKMMNDFIRIVTNFQTEDVMKDNITSNIKEIATKINEHPRGGIFKKKKRWLTKSRQRRNHNEL